MRACARYDGLVFFRKAALRPVPPWAVVDEMALDGLEASLGEDDDGLQGVLDAGYREMDRLQPHLAEWLAGEVSSEADELAQSVGYFLVVTVYLAFREAFPTRLDEVDEAALHIALETLEVDEELRAADPTEVLESDDVVAMGQPNLVSFVREQVEAALEPDEDGEAADVDLDAVAVVYRAVLVEILALGQAVSAPRGAVSTQRFLA